jgi:hypothetical protein
MVFETPEGDLLIYDWKRVREISYESSYNQYGMGAGLENMPDTNFWHYSLQLNIYRALLERNYGKKVVGLCLVCLHPENYSENYELIPISMLDTEVDHMLNSRRDAVSAL